MTTRRDFIGGMTGAMAGVAFVGCELMHATHAHAQPAPRRREVVVNGRRVKTVDVHAHCAFPDAMALMGLKVNPETLVMGTERIKAMDEQGIDVEALSINAYWYKADRDLARQLIKLQNEKLAALCAAQPDRFVAFASVALQYPDLAAEQLDDAVKKLGLRGAAIGGSVNGEELADPKFHPFWAKAEELGCLVFIHPQANPDFEKRLKGNGGLINVIGNPLETTIALSHMIYEGTLDRYPGLKICAAHGGGYLPSYAARSDAGCTTFPGSLLRRADQEEADRISAAALFRFDHLHVGGFAAPGGGGRRQPDRHGDGLSVSLDQHFGRSHPQHSWPQRCRPRGDAWGHRCEALGDQVVSREACHATVTPSFAVAGGRRAAPAGIGADGSSRKPIRPNLCASSSAFPPAARTTFSGG